jgi:hypothetical protein
VDEVTCIRKILRSKSSWWDGGVTTERREKVEVDENEVGEGPHYF